MRQHRRIEGPKEPTATRWPVVFLFALLGANIVLHGVTLYYGNLKIWKVEREIQSVWSQNHDAEHANARDVEYRFDELDKKIDELRTAVVDIQNQTQEIDRIGQNLIDTYQKVYDLDERFYKQDVEDLMLRVQELHDHAKIPISYVMSRTERSQSTKTLVKHRQCHARWLKGKKKVTKADFKMYRSCTGE